MSGEKRWSVDPFGGISWSSGGWSHGVDLTTFLGFDDPVAAHAALVADVRAAARLRSLAAIYEQPLNRDTTFTFTGRALAEMLRGEG